MININQYFWEYNTEIWGTYWHLTQKVFSEFHKKLFPGVEQLTLDVLLMVMEWGLRLLGLCGAGERRHVSKRRNAAFEVGALRMGEEEN